MSLWLSKEELIELTGYKTSRCQKRALAEMGVEFRSRAADGFPLVLRTPFDGEHLTARERRREPRLEFVRQ